MVGRIWVGRKRKSLGARRPCGELYAAKHLNPALEVGKIPNRRGVSGEKRCSVYVVEAGPAVKIGVSSDVQSRALKIQTDQPYEVRVFWAVSLRREDAYRIENTVHRYLRRKVNVSRGEWFHISSRAAMMAIQDEIKLAGIKDVLPDPVFGFDRHGEEQDCA